MSGTALLIKGGYVITADSAIGDLPVGDVLVRDGLITDVATEVAVDVDEVEIVDARGRLVLPGFIDTHRHLWLGALSSGVEATSLQNYSDAVMGRLAPRYRPEDVYAGTLWGALLGIHAGVTTVADWAHNLPTAEHTAANIAALRDSGINAVFLYGGSIDDARRVREQWPDVTMGLALRGPLFSTPAETRSEILVARELALPISIHAGMAGFPSAVRQLADENLLGPDVNYAHGNEFTAEELAMLAATGGTIAASPTVDMTLGLGAYPAVGMALEHHVPVGLAADTVASGGADLLSEMRLTFAAERARRLATHSDRPPISARDVLDVATRGGASVWRLEGRTGTLTPGKAADIAVVDTRAPHLDGFDDPFLAVLLNAGPSDVETVVIGGEIVKAHGRLVGPHAEAARALLDASRDHLRRSA